ncbi:MAG: DUF4192 domain-containing protein [Actinobacteria bacterium]|nr:DUF4192 domain-containing protein [Actinomycetota bacterium]MCA1721541.1 DUF4192 domain-containing protein [Actinomycetota bacterium]
MTSAPALVSSPAEVAALVPHLVGFVPEESLVLACLRGPRRRVGLTMRVDLPDGVDAPEAAAALVARVAHERATAALLVVYTEGADGRDALVDAIDEALADQGIALQEALLVRRGRWTSYLCDDATCCPADGTPLDPAPSAALSLVRAEQALAGRAVLPSRADLVAALAPPGACTGVAAAAQAVTREVRTRGRKAVRVAALAQWRAAVAAATDPRATPDDPRLAVALQDVLVRDAVLSWAADDPEPLGRVLTRLCRCVGAPFDVPVCTLLAVTAWLQGDGALANVALDRALAGEPTYSLAVLVRQGLDQQVRPAAVRAWLRAAGDACPG